MNTYNLEVVFIDEKGITRPWEESSPKQKEFFRNTLAKGVAQQIVARAVREMHDELAERERAISEATTN